MARLLVIGNPENRRTRMVAEALTEAGWEFDHFPYVSLLTRPEESLPKLIRRAARADVIRLDSPAENFNVDRQLLAWGACSAQAEGVNYLTSNAALALSHDRGRIICPRQYYLGYAQLLAMLEDALPQANWMNHPSEVLCMFDKPSTIERLSLAGISTPPAIGVVRNYDELSAGMAERNWDRVFIKIANGSSASGVAAVHHHGADIWALTSVETDRGATSAQGFAEPKYYNSLRLQRYEGDEVRQLVNALAGERLYAEQWLPKARDAQGDEFDLRIVAVAGRPTHGVMRIGSSPMTNLHLGNRRGDYAQLRVQLGAERCQRLDSICEQTAAAFPQAHYLGIDVMLAPDFEQLHVLEVNAFGDLIPNVVDEFGLGTHAREIRDWTAE